MSSLGSWPFGLSCISRARYSFAKNFSCGQYFDKQIFAPGWQDLTLSRREAGASVKSIIVSKRLLLMLYYAASPWRIGNTSSLWYLFFLWRCFRILVNAESGETNPIRWYWPACWHSEPELPEKGNKARTAGQLPWIGIQIWFLFFYRDLKTLTEIKTWNSRGVM